MSLLTTWRERRAVRAADHRLAVERAVLRESMLDTWRNLCENLDGLNYPVQVATGTTVRTPRLMSVTPELDDVYRLNIRMLEGQVPADFVQHSGRIAGTFDVPLCRVAPDARDRVLHVRLYRRDPLDIDVPVPPAPRSSSVNDTPVILAVAEGGGLISTTWDKAGHLVLQGMTRSGKSVFAYSLLSQLAAMGDVVIAGSDPSGLLLGDVYNGSRHREWQAAGSGDVHAHLDVLARVVDEMDARIAGLPEDADKIDRFSPEQPLITVVLEEFAGLVRRAGLEKGKSGEPKLADQIRALYGRLISEGHKAGIRLVLITQRASAAIIGGDERGNFGFRISFRVEDPESLEMLHGSLGRVHAEEHRHALQGICLIEGGHWRLTRAKGARLASSDPDTPDFLRYFDRIGPDASARLRLVEN